MKHIIYSLLLIVMVTMTSGCKDKEEVIPTETVPEIVGEWHCEVDRLEVDIYIGFNAAGTFELYQKIGDGFYRKYTGTWKMDGNILSGSYSDDEVWGSSYVVSFDGDSKMTLEATEDPHESYTYSRESIPSEIIDGSVDVKTSGLMLNSQPQYRWL